MDVSYTYWSVTKIIDVVKQLAWYRPSMEALRKIQCHDDVITNGDTANNSIMTTS